MKLKVNWKELMKQLWAAIRPVLLGAIGDGIGPIDDVVSTLGSVIETPPGFFDYSDIPARAYV